MSKWTLTQSFGAAVCAVLFAFGTLWLAALALNLAQLPTVVYDYEATACVQVRDTAISEMVRARSTASALETRAAAVGFADNSSCEPTLQALETRAAEVECVLLDVASAIVAAIPNATPCPSRTPTTVTPEPSETPTAMPTLTPRPTATLEFLPTVTPTPTPVPLCHACDVSSSPRYNCPSGYWCKECASGKWRCVRNASPSADCQTCLAAAMPVASPEWSMTGLVTWYEDSIETASGEPFDATAMAGAVDASLFNTFLNRILHVCTIPGYGVNEARCIEVRVNDCGNLLDAGQFVYEMRPRGRWDVQRWWEGDGDGALSIIVDLTKSAMHALTNGSLETCGVQVTVLESGQ